MLEYLGTRKQERSPVLTPGQSQRVNMENHRRQSGVVLLWVTGAASAARIFYVWRCFPIANTGHQTNEEIRDKEVRLISESGEQLGIMSSQEALRLAEERNLDLVKISPNAVPPVCKLMDYGKYRFEQSKREKEARKNQKTIDIKEIRLSLNIDVNDFNTKVKQAIKFLEGGDKVKVSIRFRGREMAHPDLGTTIMQRFTESVAGYGTVEKQPKLEGRSMTMFVTAKNGK